MTDEPQSARNETSKLTANFTSNLGVGLITAGVFAPALSLLSEYLMLTRNEFLYVGAGCVVLSAILRWAARSALRSIQ
ncbi:hypothetical protein [Rhodopseudomonas palustris]|uniref:Uncharacterized protein n=1 Tax=Rhodopseudomonas palustris TaxID=1076 RepID=A0A418VM80_RHOPL|nr:hypothetical protein [Rhodopseudomonas palustris]RJF77162.1 hypothetical protein D4Q52_04920 [Rhodopseudomonas palustris]